MIPVALLVTFLLVMLRHAAQIVGERSFRDIMRGREAPIRLFAAHEVA
ncbi:MAG: hypothetical protein JNM79_01605 [Burkholderiales bacterium]|nr:hypothetical protein [Burkholderiales bacterium]